VHAVTAGEAEVEQDRVVGDFAERAVGGAAVGEPVDREAKRAQAARQAIAEQGVVLDDQHAHARQFTGRGQRRSLPDFRIGR
jgi:hypothetical protein